MRSCKTLLLAIACLGVSGLIQAQQPAATPATDIRRYDVRRETNIVGTVVAFDANSEVAPFGARVTLQTISGSVRVHLGDVRLLSANHFTIQTGDTLRIVGEPLASHETTIFAARIVQKGTRALTLRTPQGSPAPYVAPRNSSSSASQRGVV